MPEELTVSAYYDALTALGDDPARDPEPLRAYMDRWDGSVFLERLALSPELSVLELGVGTGRLARRVAPLCGDFAGIDLSPAALARAGENLADRKNVTLLAGDFLDYPFDRTFDRVYSSLTFFHIQEKERAVRRIRELLRPGGRLVLSVDKSQASFLRYSGDLALPLWPDPPGETAKLLSKELTLLFCDETEAAHIFTAERPK